MDEEFSLFEPDSPGDTFKNWAKKFGSKYDIVDSVEVVTLDFFLLKNIRDMSAFIAKLVNRIIEWFPDIRFQYFKVKEENDFIKLIGYYYP